MKRRPSVGIEIFSLSAIDIFASAMGAFIIISVILMPDYQKEMRQAGDLSGLKRLVEELVGKAATNGKQERELKSKLKETQARLRQAKKIAQAKRAELASRPVEPAKPAGPVNEPASVSDKSTNQVTFRMLGLRTDARKISLLIDVNKDMSQHEAALRKNPGSHRRFFSELPPGSNPRISAHRANDQISKLARRQFRRNEQVR